jgi:hypothetical protein
MLLRVALARTDASEERIALIIMVTRIGGLGTSAVTSSMLLFLDTTNIVTSSLNLVFPMKEVIHSYEMSSLTTATWHNILEDGIFQILLIFTYGPSAHLWYIKIITVSRIVKKYCCNHIMIVC